MVLGCPHCKKIKPEFSRVAREVNTENKVTELLLNVAYVRRVVWDIRQAVKTPETRCPSNLRTVNGSLTSSSSVYLWCFAFDVTGCYKEDATSDNTLTFSFHATACNPTIHRNFSIDHMRSQRSSASCAMLISPKKAETAVYGCWRLSFMFILFFFVATGFYLVFSCRLSAHAYRTNTFILA